LIQNRIYKKNHILVIKKENLKEAIQTGNIISVDGFWKFLYKRKMIKEEIPLNFFLFTKINDKFKRVKFPIYYFASLNSAKEFIHIGFTFKNQVNGEMLAKAVTFIGEEYKKLNPNKVFRPKMVNYGGTIEEKMNAILIKNNQIESFILCKFHFIVSIFYIKIYLCIVYT
jgi:hypothetical protein